MSERVCVCCILSDVFWYSNAGKVVDAHNTRKYFNFSLYTEFIIYDFWCRGLAGLFFLLNILYAIWMRNLFNYFQLAQQIVFLNKRFFLTLRHTRFFFAGKITTHFETLRKESMDGLLTERSRTHSVSDRKRIQLSKKLFFFKSWWTVLCLFSKLLQIEFLSKRCRMFSICIYNIIDIWVCQSYKQF